MRYTKKEQTLILNLINYFTSERDAGKTLLPLTAVHNRVADALGGSMRTVQTIGKSGVTKDEDYKVKVHAGHISARGEIPADPVIAFLNQYVFSTLRQGLILLLEKVREEKSFYRPKSSLNGIDFLSEYLYNMNPNYPERKEHWTYIFDMEWVQKHLEASPRPYYPFSLIWTRQYAALKIQSYMRGYFIRRREDVQEVRNFWKEYKLAKVKGASEEN